MKMVDFSKMAQTNFSVILTLFCTLELKFPYEKMREISMASSWTRPPNPGRLPGHSGLGHSFGEQKNYLCQSIIIIVWNIHLFFFLWNKSKFLIFFSALRWLVENGLMRRPLFSRPKCSSRKRPVRFLFFRVFGRSVHFSVNSNQIIILSTINVAWKSSKKSKM